jgi:vanillate O-demethylase monooxygenase subunit
MPEGSSEQRNAAPGRYLMNCWYVAAWSSELASGAHMKRVLLDLPVLLLRDANGTAAAIGNVCPHRFASLSAGVFDGAVVECPYHGLQFDTSGRCVHNPHGDGRIAERAQVPAYPLAERHGALWIWLGDAAAADVGLIPDLGFLNTENPADRAPGYLYTKANYQLMSDNILDLSHADFLHRATLGTGTELTGSLGKARSHGDTVTMEWSFDGKGMMIQRPMRNDADIHMRFEVTWHPAGVMIIRNEINLLGEPEAKTRKAGVHIMTPETPTSTHYFFENGEAERRKMLSLALDVFESEDGVMLEDIQRNMNGADFWDLEPLVLSNDSGAILARRTLQRRIRAEAAAPA